MHCGANLSAGRTALPLGRGLRSTPTQIAHGRRRERNASIDGQAVFDCAFQLALFNLRGQESCAQPVQQNVTTTIVSKSLLIFLFPLEFRV